MFSYIFINNNYIYKNKKAVVIGLQEIYKAADENQAELDFDAFEDKLKSQFDSYALN